VGSLARGSLPEASGSTGSGRPILSRGRERRQAGAWRAANGSSGLQLWALGGELWAVCRSREPRARGRGAHPHAGAESRQLTAHNRTLTPVTSSGLWRARPR
jgi:hypothetical protein